MAQITTDDLTQLAALSALSLSTEEAEALRTDIENILSYVEQLDEIDTSSQTPRYQVTGLQNVFRPDTVMESAVDREQLLGLAPESANNQIKVPKVL